MIVVAGSLRENRRLFFIATALLAVMTGAEIYLSAATSMISSAINLGLSLSDPLLGYFGLSRFLYPAVRLLLELLRRPR